MFGVKPMTQLILWDGISTLYWWCVDLPERENLTDKKLNTELRDEHEYNSLSSRLKEFRRKLPAYSMKQVSNTLYSDLGL